MRLGCFPGPSQKGDEVFHQGLGVVAQRGQGPLRRRQVNRLTLVVLHADAEAAGDCLLFPAGPPTMASLAFNVAAIATCVRRWVWSICSSTLAANARALARRA